MTRAVVIGARCAQQGIGEFVTRSLHESGVEIAAIVGTTAPTLLEAANTLRERYEIECHMYVNFAEALEKEKPDVVAICSPYGVHERQLRQTAAANAHCLCEKPMWWRDDADIGGVTTDIVREFTQRDLGLRLVTQWPYTIPTYYEIFPEVREQKIDSFDMLLSPTRLGPLMVLDAAPHCLSMLQALVGVGEVREAAVSYPQPTEMHLTFEYHTAQGPVATKCRFGLSKTRPRPASYAVNGHEVDRTIELPDYHQYFVAGDRKVALPDPLALLVEDFVRGLGDAPRPDAAALVSAMTELETLYRAAEAVEAPASP